MNAKCKTAISDVKGHEGKLFYRGYPIEELVELSFEQVSYLIAHGELPSNEQHFAFRLDLLEVMGIENDRLRMDSGSVQNSTTGLLVTRDIIEVLKEQRIKSAWDAQVHARYKNNQDRALQLMALFALVVARYSRLTRGLSIVQPHRYYSYAKNMLYMIRGEEPSEKETRIFEKALIMHMEHSYNASTYSARISASTGANVYACADAGLSALSGKFHGGACEEIWKMINRFRPEDLSVSIQPDSQGIEEWVKDRLERSKTDPDAKIMGLGHRVYKVLDPRAIIITGLIMELCLEKDWSWFVLEAIRKTAEAEKGIYPNIDFYSGMLYRALGIPQDILVGLFAIARLNGWLAHISEQYETGTLLRPPEDEVEYTGPYSNGRHVPEVHKSH